MTLDEGVAKERTRANLVKVLLVLGMVVDAVAILSGLSQRGLLSRAASGIGITDAEATANDARHAMIGLVQLVLFLATAIFWLIWLYRAYGNLTVMGSKRADYTPGWAVGYWFIPIMNLFRPYQITKELWLRSERRNSDESIAALPAPAVVSLWWGVYLISGILGRVSMRWSLSAETIDELQRATLMGIALDGIGILSAMLALAVVNGIDALQKQTVSDGIEPTPSGVMS